MTDTFYWFGLAHAVVYSLCGAVFVFIMLFDWFAKSLGISRDLVRMYGRYLKEKRAAKDLAPSNNEVSGDK